MTHRPGFYSSYDHLILCTHKQDRLRGNLDFQCFNSDMAVQFLLYFVFLCNRSARGWSKIWLEALHITQAITQPKIAKIAQITQNNTSFGAHFWAFYGLLWGSLRLKNVFLTHFRKIEFCLNLFIMKKFCQEQRDFHKVAKIWGQSIDFMVPK